MGDTFSLEVFASQGATVLHQIGDRYNEIAKTSRVCAHSRSGILWSDPNPGNFSSQAVAQDLHQALMRSGESAPWVMVGHSLGGPYIMMFTSLYPSEVAGLVFVDASHPDQVERSKTLDLPSDLPSSSMVLLWNLSANTEIMRLIAINPTPEHALPNVKAIGQVFLPQTMESLSKEILGEQIMCSGSLWKELQADEATWSSCSRHQLVSDSSHYIQFDRPDVVIKAVNRPPA